MLVCTSAPCLVRTSQVDDSPPSHSSHPFSNHSSTKKSPRKSTQSPRKANKSTPQTLEPPLERNRSVFLTKVNDLYHDHQLFFKSLQVAIRALVPKLSSKGSLNNLLDRKHGRLPYPYHKHTPYFFLQLVWIASPDSCPQASPESLCYTGTQLHRCKLSKGDGEWKILLSLLKARACLTSTSFMTRNGPYVLFVSELRLFVFCDPPFQGPEYCLVLFLPKSH